MFLQLFSSFLELPVLLVLSNRRQREKARANVFWDFYSPMGGLFLIGFSAIKVSLAIAGCVAIFGLWHMKKWGAVLLLFIVVASAVVNLLYGEEFVLSFLIPVFLALATIVHFPKMN